MTQNKVIHEWLLLITSHVLPRETVASTDPVAHNSLIFLDKLWKGHVNSPGAVSAVFEGISYDGVDIVKFPAVSKGMKHDATDSVASLELPSIIG